MSQIYPLVLAASAFFLISLASARVGRVFANIKLPMISGFLLTGILAGPYLLGLLSSETVARLTFLDEIALGIIAFAAGSELHLQELRSRIKSIIWVVSSNSIIVPILGTVVTFFLADFIPFMQPLSTMGRIAVALLAGAILVARSPSSAIAIVNELRARGPFTQSALGVTMLSDVVIIILFAIAASTAGALLTSRGLQLDFVLILGAELLVSLIIGYLLGRLLHTVLSLHLNASVKAAIVVVSGYSIFLLSSFVDTWSHNNLPFEAALEPLLICMIGGFVVTNTSPFRTEFLQILHDVGPPIYVIFFTLTGAGLRLDIFLQIWTIALVLFVVRLVAIFASSYLGGLMAGDSPLHNRLSWMTYITQAGVALGLSKEVAVEFPEWGDAFATMLISSIVVSQIVGPPLFKWAIQRAGEAHTQAPGHEFDGVRDAVIFGLDGQTIALARLLQSNGWNTKIASRRADALDTSTASDIEIHYIPDLSLESLEKLDLQNADALVAMLSNDENYQICEIAYEHFGIKRKIVHLTERETSNRFAELGAIVFEPTTALVSLLDHFVRAPAVTSLLLEQEDNQHVADIDVTNPSLHGLTIRDLRLPLDVLIVSVHRNGTVLPSHGYTRLELHDCVSVLGTSEGIAQAMLLLEA